MSVDGAVYLFKTRNRIWIGCTDYRNTIALEFKCTVCLFKTRNRIWAGCTD